MTDDAAKDFLCEARALFGAGSTEHPLRALFQQHLPLMFPGRPWWVQHHAKGVERHTRTVRDARLASGFIDALVGATIIEYEADLGRQGVEDHARLQIREYVAGQINDGVDASTLRGVVSDTLRWRAYEATVTGPPSGGPLGERDVALKEIDRVDLTAPSPGDAADLRRFLERHLGRVGARPLNAGHLADDLGLGSPHGRRRRTALAKVHARKAADSPDYAELVARLWSELVDAIGRSGSRQFGVDEYLDEFYLITLAKLICANVLEPATHARPDAQIEAILVGDFFTGRGLPNYVEYDLFGWLSDDAAATGLLAIARDIHSDLTAYDFKAVASGDIFGGLLANLGSRHTRLILGQELTPPWLARSVVHELASRLHGQPMRLLDTACGSGAMLVEGLAAEAARTSLGVTAKERAERLLGSVTGFDIDPLAALFAKTNWVIAMRDHLEHLGDVTIPVFNADSLFGGIHGEDDAFRLKLDEEYVEPPRPLLDAAGRPVFDAVLSKAYGIALDEARGDAEPDTSASTAIAAAAMADAAPGSIHDPAEISAFAASLIRQIALLQRRRRNGLWLYVIRNISRASQSSGQFNALAMNPPWLALSKIGDNPYGSMLARFARELGVQPAAQSFLHTEMSVIFLLEGVRRYLAPDGVFGCILPGAVANGNHQNRFRSGAFTTARRSVDLDVDTLWQVEPSPFKNQAIVLFGSRTPFLAKTGMPGRTVSADVSTDRPVKVVTASYPDQPDRTVWVAGAAGETVGFGLDAAPFRQGADLMPRVAWFHEPRRLSNGRVALHPAADSPAHRYLVAEAKKGRDSRLPTNPIDEAFIFEALLSHHLTPFAVSAPAAILLPGRPGPGGWTGAQASDFTMAGAGTRQAFDAIARQTGASASTLFALVDERRKLRNQTWPAGSHIVLSGAGGANPCAAWLEPGAAPSGRLVFDQTLYWVAVATLSEAAYLAGAIGSPRCAELIAPFQPMGQQDKRHVHKLPFGITPRFDPGDGQHVRLSQATIALAVSLDRLADRDPAIARARRPDGGSLAHRRRKIATALRGSSAWAEYEASSAAIYDV